MTEHDDTPRDPALSHRYREAGTGPDMAPPPALDAKILAAARTAAQPQTAAVGLFPPRWRRRLALPVGVMAVAVLAVTLSLTVQRHAPDAQERNQVAPKAPAATAPAASDFTPQRPPAAAAERTDSAPPVPGVPARRTERTERTERTPRVAEKKDTQQPLAPAASAALPEPARVSPPTSAVPPPSPAVSGEAAAVSSRQKVETTADRAQESAAKATLQKAAPAAAAPAQLGAAKGEVSPPVQTWLEEIRELRRQGREEEAARRLAEFRKAYPGYVLPEDLR